ncbi:MAG TPA: lactate dehydrogenase [Methanoregulaceae archaeon]|nr:MAG: lactate dehydrogenase [Methanolinea sp.]HON81456.1 lactate dehydrogenase [Methanoregulaceae archaeon]HPD10016.1 lactate dehydrogenase [Methanoregulaceae archaeon]HRT15022.1 lactate dehydrogenase [Methanoregulaceae archaeon]HRU30593.1 lactate dehydrogenase [Methanoregulaceae archaeon]
MTRLAVLGVGRIGGEVAFLSSVLGLADDLVLFDTAETLLRSQVLDLIHTGLDITISTDWRDTAEADICVFAAGIPRNPAVKSRADLLSVNLPVASSCSRALTRFSGVLITVTNPMDANNYYLCRNTGLEPRQCIGFGGQIDSARFGTVLQEQGISGTPWVIGEHGEHQVPVFSRLEQDVPEPLRDDILESLRKASMEVIRGKGGTEFGPALHIAHLIRIISGDERTLLPCSCVLEGEYGLDRCSLGVPAAVGRNGIHSISEWDLDGWEQEKFKAAGAFVTDLCTRLGI